MGAWHHVVVAGTFLLAAMGGCHLVGGTDEFTYATDGAGGCSPERCPGDDAPCRARACVDGGCGFADRPAGSPCDTPAGGVCDGAGDCVECIDASQCDPGQICDQNRCGPGSDKAPGEPCDTPDECTSGHCPADDGVCCDRACDGVCEACVASKTSTADGTCAPVDPALDPDPDSECADQGPSSCGASGEGCSGIDASCVKYAVGTPCSDASCLGSTFTDAATCDGEGTCAMPMPTSCAPYQCDTTGTACSTACTGPLDCTALSYCSVTGSCVPKKSNGTPCNSGEECIDGHCIDGLCCNTPCKNKCVACTAAKTGGADGICAVIPAGQDPDDECPGIETCDGSGACQCAGAGSGKPNGACCLSGSECDSGFCADGVCCDGPCTDPCEACVGAKSGMSDGTCAPVVAGTDPDAECPGIAACDVDQSCSTCGVNTPPTGGACPSQCTGGCINGGTTCVIDCLGFSACKAANITCPSGFDCHIRCGDQGCKDATLTCPAAEACDVSCEGVQGCRNAQVLCGMGTCETSCSIAGLVCDATTISCGANQCSATCQGVSTPTINCGSSCDCQGC